MLQLEDEMVREFSHLMWETQKLRVIKAGTLPRLVEALATVRGELDSSYMNIFLATYRTFATPLQLLQAIVDRWIFNHWKKLRDLQESAFNSLNATFFCNIYFITFAHFNVVFCLHEWLDFLLLNFLWCLTFIFIFISFCSLFRPDFVTCILSISPNVQYYPTCCLCWS